MRSRPILFGEVLFDVFPDGQRVPGGAPLNVCWHLQAFGASPLLLSRVGEDPDGHRVRDSLVETRMDLSGLQFDPQRPTGQVRVRFDDGQPAFDIVADQAYDHIEAEPALQATHKAHAGLFYRGTLAARSATNQSTLARLHQQLRLPEFIDVNLRPPWWRREDVEQALHQARWAKLNDAELMLLTGCEDKASVVQEAARKAREDWRLDLLIVTLGADGALWVEADRTCTARPPALSSIVDTVGAGDAFSAVSILGLIHEWDAETILERALEFAARVCQQRGAVIADPATYQRYRENWGE